MRPLLAEQGLVVLLGQFPEGRVLYPFLHLEGFFILMVNTAVQIY